MTTTMTIGRKRGIGFGALFFSVFGALWLTGAAALAYGRNVSIDTTIWAIGALIFFAALRVILTNKLPKGDAVLEAQLSRRGKIFMIVNVIQYAAIFLMVHLLGSYGYSDWQIPTVMLIVGLHFFPLAKLFSNRAHVLTGAALVALAIIYPFAGHGPLDPVGSLGAGLILWAAAVHGLAGATTSAAVVHQLKGKTWAWTGSGKH